MVHSFAVKGRRGFQTAHLRALAHFTKGRLAQGQISPFPVVFHQKNQRASAGVALA
jgi:hypothetical protein